MLLPEQVESALIFAGILTVIVFVFLILVNVPMSIADTRMISSGNKSTVKLLAWIGVLIPIVWIIALVLACTYPPAYRRTYRRPSADDFPEITA